MATNDEIDVSLDIEEVSRLLKLAQRPTVRSLLTLGLSRMYTEQARLIATAPSDEMPSATNASTILDPVCELGADALDADAVLAGEVMSAAESVKKAVQVVNSAEVGNVPDAVNAVHAAEVVLASEVVDAAEASSATEVLNAAEAVHAAEIVLASEVVNAAEPVGAAATNDNAKPVDVTAISISSESGRASIKKPKAATSSSTKFDPVSSFFWEQTTENIVIYVNLEGVRRSQVQVEFNKRSVDLKVNNMATEGNGYKSYRFLKTHLSHEVVPDECVFKVLKKRIKLILIKVPGQYGIAEHWTELEDKSGKDKKKEAGKSDDPAGGLMDVMKDLYEKGDDTMRKTIGEAMLKSRQGGGGGADLNFE